MAAKVASLMIDLAADVAGIRKDFDAAAQVVQGFGQKVDQIGSQVSSAFEKSKDTVTELAAEIAKTGGSVDSFLAVLKTGAAGLGVGAVVSQVVAYAAEIQKAAVTTADLATKSGLTAQQMQAIQLAATKSGQSVEGLTTYYKGNADALNKMTDYAKQASLVMSDSVVKSLKEAADASDDASRRMQVFFAPAVAGTKSWIADALERMKADLDAVGQHADLIDKIAAVLRMLAFGGSQGSAQQFHIEEYEKAVTEAEDKLRILTQPAQASGMGITGRLYPPDPNSSAITEAKKNLDDARIALGKFKDAQQAAAYGPQTMPAVPVIATAGGGGGKTDEDSIERQIARYDLLTKSAQRAYATIVQGEATSLEYAERQVRVQQQVDDIVARLTTKRGVAPGADEVERLRASVQANEQQRDANAKLAQSQTQAAATEDKLGDGTLRYLKIQQDLTNQLATNRLGHDAYTRALKQAKEETDNTALAASRYDDDIQSLGNGIQYAANQFARANDNFSLGQQVFTGFTNAMGQGLDVLMGKSSATFGQIASDFAAMLAKMAFQAAVSQVFKVVFGSLLGDPTAAVTPGPMPAGGYVAGVGQSGQGFLAPARASGGPVTAGMPYMVGEAGPETFVPRTSGTIVPANSNSPAGTINVNVDMGQTSGTADPSTALAFGKKVRAAVVDVIANEKRPGGTLYRRLTN